MGHDDDLRAERAETQELLDLPPSIENLDSKLSHLITHLFVTERLCERAARASEAAEKIATEAKVAAHNAAASALAAMQSREPLSRKERFTTVFVGSAVGGAVSWAFLAALGLFSTAVTISSCGAH